MKILTSDKRIVSQLDGTILVSPKAIHKFDGDVQVQIIVGSRELAHKAEAINLPGLKFVQLLSAGYDGVDIEKYRSRNVLVSNAANVYGIGMAEYVVYGMLMSAKRYNKGIRNSSIRYQRGYNWITELAGKIVGILGCGTIGLQIAKRLSGFDMTILGYDLFRDSCDYVEKIYKNLNEFLPLCDYLIITVPYNESTQGMINADFLSKCKKNATIINVGRIGLIKDVDFLEALKENKEMSAILDMFEVFPNPITNPYRRLSNVKVLPGITAISQEITTRREKLVKENISRLLNNEKPLFVL